MNIKRKLLLAVVIVTVLIVQQVQSKSTKTADSNTEFDLHVLLELSVGSRIGQLRAVRANLGKGSPQAILAVYCADAEVDPYVEMFFFPRDTLKLMLFTEKGKVLWRRDLGRAVVPGIWFCPVYPFDLDGDGVDEILWGERCIELDTGKELFCADREVYRGHSDVIQPVFNTAKNRWFIYTCRESGNVSPRVALFDDKGQRIWGDVKQGHMDMGWTARIGENGEHIAMAIRIGGKSAGPKGFFREEVEEFTYRAFTGEKHRLPFSVFCTLPVDLNGDGTHELVRGLAEGNGEVFDHKGRIIGNVKGSVAIASKLLTHPGEQILCYYPDGTIRVWADRNAKDNAEALARYNHPFYKANQRLTATGYNIVNLGGI